MSDKGDKNCRKTALAGAITSLCLSMAIFFGLSGQAAGAATRLYVTNSTGYNIPGDAPSTNVAAGSTTTGANVTYVTLLSSSLPSNSSTEMRSTYPTAGSWYTVSRAYYTTAFTSASRLAANAVGKISLRSSSTSDRFEMILRDYDPTTGSGSATGAAINTVTDIPSPGSTMTTKTINFTNANYSLPQGHYLVLEVRFKPASNNNYARVACNSSNQSYVDAAFQFSITSSSGINGSITPNGVTWVDNGSGQTYTITATINHIILTLILDSVTPVPGAVGQGSSSYTGFTAVNCNHTIDAQFQNDTGTFNVAPGLGGCITVVGYGACPGTTSGIPPWAGRLAPYAYPLTTGAYTFQVVPDAGYGIEQVLVDGADQGVPLGQTTLWTNSPVTLFHGTTKNVTASFLPYIRVTSGAGSGGNIDPSGSTPVLRGQAVTFAMAPDTNYRLLSITDNGVNVGNNLAYSLTNVTAPHDVIATFQPTHLIHASAGPNGTISPIGDTVVDGGSNMNFSISPAMGFKIADLLVDGTSVGALSSYNFTNVTASHTISATFAASPIPGSYCAVPPYVSTPAPPNVMIMLSVEEPMQGAANPKLACSGVTRSSFSYACSSTGLGNYDNDGAEYSGYFDSGKCYSYSGSGATGLFSPSGAATNHQCNNAWSGNMLNWSTMLAVDSFRKAFTGGNRTVDVAGGDTVLLAAFNDGRYFPVTPMVTDAELYMPVSGTNQTRYIVRSNGGSGFGVCGAGQTTCSISRSTTTGEGQWPVAGVNTTSALVYSLRIKACSSVGGAESRCNSTNNKPEGTIQKNMDKMRFGLMSYAADNSQQRDGGVLREKMKWLGPTIPNGLKYHDASNSVVTCSTSAGCDNPEKELNTDGTIINNPLAASGNSGLINYINKFAYTSGYKQYDPVSELYYQVVRYFRNQTPSGSNYCTGLTEPNDNFPLYCNASKTNARGWRDPALYSCSKNFVIAINDANPWLDKRIPGTHFIADYGLSQSSLGDWCGSSQGGCDTDFIDNGVQVDVEGWTKSVGDIEGITGRNIGHSCEVNSSGVCMSPVGNVTNLGRVIFTSKGNTFLVAGLAYYAHMSDLRPDLPGTQNLTTFMIDTQEPAGSMVVGPKNALQLAGKYGGFDDKDGSGKPYNGATCGVGSSSPNPLCGEWDADNDGAPDNYFFASDSSKVESGLDKAFSSILNRATAGTAAAVANNRSGERGANVIQAIFYPQWPLSKSIMWLGDVQALWFYLDPLVKYSGVYEDSDMNKELNLDQDRIPSADSLQVKALWKAGDLLLARDAATRTIYTLLDPSQPLTNSVNSFVTSQRTALKPLLNMTAATDGDTDAIINYVRGVDSGSLRSRTVTYNSITGAWKLGDIINSTPQIQGSQPLNSYATDYNDSSYGQFTGSNQYLSNNYVYAGANDGMLHAFRLGLVRTISSTNIFRIAQIIDDTDLGKEEWAFIPKNVLPYLKNCADSSYCHQYLVDGTPLIFDASINRHTDCSTGNYWDCPRKSTLSSGNLDLTRTSWQSLLIGSMGHGGATRDSNCNETLNHDADPTNNIDCIKTPVMGGGFSSYFALDITTPLAPKFLWEFSDGVLPAADRGLGLTTPGPAVVRINSRAGTPPIAMKTTNGRWFALFASGPTGPIDQATRQMKGRSDQNLKLYVVDINPFDTTTGFVKCSAAGQSNCNYWIKDTGVKYAFAHSLYKSVIDLDRANSTLDGYYSDDVVYVTYTRATLDATGVNSGTEWDHGPPYPTAWDKGGILRLVTNNDPDPANWFISTLIDNGDIGPITSSVDLLQDRTNKKLWLFFGEGLYFSTGDDLNSQRRIFGITDPCYRSDLGYANTFYDTAGTCPAMTMAQLKDQTSTPTAPLTTEKGWYISLTAASGTSGAERLYGKLVANTTGVVFYPTFTPSTDICTAGGTTSLWSVKYNTGGTPPKSGLQGKLVATTTDTPIPKTVNLDGAFTRSGGRQLDSGIVLSGASGGGGGGVGGSGTMVRNPAPSKRVINVQER